MKNWKSTSVGGVAAVLFIGYKMYKGMPIEFNDIVMALGLLGVGAVTKDATTHSTQADVMKATEKALDKAIAPAQPDVATAPDHRATE